MVSERCLQCGKPDIADECLCEDCLIDQLVDFCVNYDPEKDPDRVRLVLAPSAKTN